MQKGRKRRRTIVPVVDDVAVLVDVVALAVVGVVDDQGTEVRVDQAPVGAPGGRVADGGQRSHGCVSLKLDADGCFTRRY